MGPRFRCKIFTPLLIPSYYNRVLIPKILFFISFFIFRPYFFTITKRKQQKRIKCYLQIRAGSLPETISLFIKASLSSNSLWITEYVKMIYTSGISSADAAFCQRRCISYHFVIMNSLFRTLCERNDIHPFMLPAAVATRWHNTKGWSRKPTDSKVRLVRPISDHNCQTYWRVSWKFMEVNSVYKRTFVVQEIPKPSREIPQASCSDRIDRFANMAEGQFLLVN